MSKATKNNFNRKRRNEFRISYVASDAKHPAYIFAEVNGEFKYLGITHSPVTQGVRNIKLDKNPNPQDVRHSFARKVAKQAPKSKFSKRLTDWTMDESDRKKLKKYEK